MKPERTADTSVPMMCVSCTFQGVAPTRIAVFMSCDRSPDKEIAIQTTAPPIIAAVFRVAGSWPKTMKSSVMAMSAVIVMPETGWFVVPIKPTMRALTATKKKQKRMTTSDSKKLRPKAGVSQSIKNIASTPRPTMGSGKSCSVRLKPWPSFTE